MANLSLFRDNIFGLQNNADYIKSLQNQPLVEVNPMAPELQAQAQPDTAVLEGIMALVQAMQEQAGQNEQASQSSTKPTYPDDMVNITPEGAGVDALGRPLPEPPQAPILTEGERRRQEEGGREAELTNQLMQQLFPEQGQDVVSPVPEIETPQLTKPREVIGTQGMLGEPVYGPEETKPMAQTSGEESTQPTVEDSARKAVAEGKTVEEFVADSVPEGMTRLYRVEAKELGDKGEWLKKHLTPEQYKQFVSERGRFYSDNLQDALDYGHGNEDVNTWYVDVPTDVAKNISRVNVGGGKGAIEYVVPKEYSDKRANTADLRTAYDKAKAEVVGKESEIVKLPKSIQNYLYDTYSDYANQSGDFNQWIGNVAKTGVINKSDIKRFISDIINTDAGAGGIIDDQISDAYDDANLRSKLKRRKEALNKFKADMGGDK
jgi:hypothetical protein